MKTTLLEFKNTQDDTLRGILTSQNSKPDGALIYLHGFERNSTTETKFKRISDQLAQKK